MPSAFCEQKLTVLRPAGDFWRPLLSPPRCLRSELRSGEFLEGRQHFPGTSFAPIFFDLPNISNRIAPMNWPRTLWLAHLSKKGESRPLLPDGPPKNPADGDARKGDDDGEAEGIITADGCQ